MSTRWLFVAGSSDLRLRMAGKSLSVAKQQREKFLLEFKSAISDLEEELALSSTPDKQPNERKI